MSQKDAAKRKAYQDMYRATHRDEINAWQKAYRAAHKKERVKVSPEERKRRRNEYLRNYRETHKELFAEKRLRHKEQRSLAAKKYIANLRSTVLAAYGNKCTCCGETEPMFLCIDHINGGGGKHRKEIGKTHNFYRWLIKNNFPPGFQVLCHNCNLAKGFYKICPHQLRREIGNA